MSPREFDIHDPNPPRVPHLRGGPSLWLLFALGPLLGAVIAGVSIVWMLARMPDGNQFREITSEVAAVKLKIATIEGAANVAAAEQRGAAALQELHNKTADEKLDRLLDRRK
jgi:hypothetical protein